MPANSVGSRPNLSVRAGRCRLDARKVSLRLSPGVPSVDHAELQPHVELIGRSDLEEMVDVAGLVAELVRRVGVEPEHVTLEVRVGVGVGVPLCVVERVGPAPASCCYSLAEVVSMPW